MSLSSVSWGHFFYSQRPKGLYAYGLLGGLMLVLCLIIIQQSLYARVTKLNANIQQLKLIAAQQIKNTTHLQYKTQTTNELLQQLIASLASPATDICYQTIMQNDNIIIFRGHATSLLALTNYLMHWQGMQIFTHMLIKTIDPGLHGVHFVLLGYLPDAISQVEAAHV
jgi:hypothetical protein